MTEIWHFTDNWSLGLFTLTLDGPCRFLDCLGLFGVEPVLSAILLPVQVDVVWASGSLRFRLESLGAVGFSSRFERYFVIIISLFAFMSWIDLKYPSIHWRQTKLSPLAFVYWSEIESSLSKNSCSFSLVSVILAPNNFIRFVFAVPER